MAYAVRERSGPGPVVTIDLLGRVVDEVDDGKVGRSAETMGVGRELSMELGSLLEALITAGQRFILVNGSQMEALGATCAMALCAYGPRLARAGGALVCCAFPSHLKGLASAMPTLYAQTEELGLAACRPQSGATGALWPAALEARSALIGDDITVISLEGGYWSEPAYAELARAVSRVRTENLIFEAGRLTAFAPRGVGPFIKLVKALEERKIRHGWCLLKTLPGTFMSNSGLMNLFAYFENLEQATAALRRPAAPVAQEQETDPLEIDDLDDIEYFSKLRAEDPSRNLTERYLHFAGVAPELTERRFSFVPRIAKSRFTTVVQKGPESLVASVGWWYSHSYPELMLVSRSSKASPEKLRLVLQQIGEDLEGVQPADYQSWISDPSAFLAPRIQHLAKLASRAMQEHDLHWQALTSATPDFLERHPYTEGWDFYLQFADESLIPLLMSELS